MKKLDIKESIRQATQKAIMAKMPERTILSVERCAVLLELFYFEWQIYKDSLNMKIEFVDIEKFFEVKGILNKGQKRLMEKCANDYRMEINKTVLQLEKLLKDQSAVFDKLPESRMEELENISNFIFKEMNSKFK